MTAITAHRQHQCAKYDNVMCLFYFSPCKLTRWEKLVIDEVNQMKINDLLEVQKCLQLIADNECDRNDAFGGMRLLVFCNVVNSSVCDIL